MDTIVSNSSPLIHLFKVGSGPVLKKMFKRVIIGPAVFNETVVLGKSKGFKDAFLIESAVGDIIEMVQPSDVMKRNMHRYEAMGLGSGEAEAIAIAKDKSLRVIIDETAARSIASSEGVRYIGSLGILLMATRHGIITKAQAKSTCRQLISSGFHLTSAVLIEFEDTINGL